MSKVLFNNEIFVEPGGGSRTIVSTAPKASPLSTGNILVIGGSQGGLGYDVNRVYSFSDYQEAKDVMKGGDSLRAINLMFNPSPQFPGAKTVKFVRAQEPMVAKWSWYNATTKKITIETVDKGSANNGYVGPNNGWFVKIAQGTAASDRVVTVTYQGNTMYISDDLTTNAQIVDLINTDPFLKTYLKATLDDAAVALVDVIQALTLTVVATGKVYIGETITQAVSAASGRVAYISRDGKTIGVGNVSGTFDTTNLVTGGTSTYTFTPSGVASSLAIPLEYGLDNKVLTATDGEVKVADTDAIESATGGFSGLVTTSMKVVITDESKGNQGTYGVASVDSDTKLTLVLLDDGLQLNVDTGISFYIDAGPTVFTSAQADSALSLAETESVNLVWIDSESSTFHAKLSGHCLAAETERTAYCGGVTGETKAQAIARAVALNSELVALTYPGVYIPTEDGSATELASCKYHAALVCGLAAGVEPQVPLTRKAINVFGFEVNASDGPLKMADRNELIEGGVLYSREIEGLGFVVNQGVNTLQQNTSLWNPDPYNSSPEISLVRVKQQLQRELRESGVRLFAGRTSGSVRKEDVVALVESYLRGKVATEEVDNYILSYSNVNAVRSGDSWFASYRYISNDPINHFFVTAYVGSVG